MAMTAQQIRQMYGGSGPMAMPAYTMDDIYGGIFPSMGGGNPALNAINAASPIAPDAAPASWSAYDVATGATLPPALGVAPPLPRRRPPGAPTTLDLAAINAVTPERPVASVAGKLKPQTGGGLLSLLTGGSKNGLPGLAGLLGGPEQGGLLQMLMGGRQAPVAAPMAPARAPRTSPSLSYANRNTQGAATAVINSNLSPESKMRAARSIDGSRNSGGSSGLTANGNPGWWGS